MNETTLPTDIPKSENPELLIDYAGILKLLPHRYPFLLVDGIMSFEKEKTITGLKNITFNEEFFNGHFPQEPVMPGVLQIEALAQVSTVLIALSFEEAKGKRPAFAGIDDAKFKSPVRPGDTLHLHAELLKMRRGFAMVKTYAEVRGKMVAQATIKAAMV
ncbi:MAG: 3-hydroxyacyl-ACP dehydratase FabZ [Fibrobacteria bacterium]|nr:3-hydroxyacyl-ACP dehydratase FabZ [Fibrobacteria bacterium]